MHSVNTSRVLLGGLVAGLVINVSEFVLNGLVLANDWTAAMTALGKPGEMTPAQIAGFNVWGFCIGIVAVWLYAAMRPRFGAGPRTAISAGLVTWFLGYFLAGWAPIITGLFPTRIMLISMAWGGVEVLLATLAGAKLYREESSAAAVPVMAR